MQEDKERRALGSSFNQVIGHFGGTAGQLSLLEARR